MKPHKINIAVLGGGYSSEDEISRQSAAYVARQPDQDIYNVYLVDLDKNGQFSVSLDNKKYEIDKNDFSLTIDNETIRFDIVYPVIHGTPGEDGLLQGYFEMQKIPFIGCNSLCSALTFHKYYCNQYLRSAQIVSIAPSVLTEKKREISNEKILQTVGLPCFVKPDAGGSSFGISKVKKAEELPQALEKAFAESKQVIVEKFIPGKEISCGMFKANGKSYPLPPAEIVSKNEFFDYQAKYDASLNEEIIPARLSEKQRKECQQITSKIYDLLNCKGIVRVDYILSENEFYFLEINTIPGMTQESIVPKMLQAAGISFAQAAELLINDILKK